MRTSSNPLKDTNRSIIYVLVALVCTLAVAGCVPSAASARPYTVQPGDTLARISAANGTTVERLVELNVEAHPSLGSNPDAIEVGWELKLPGRSEPVVSAGERSSTARDATVSRPTASDQDAFEAEIANLVNEERAKAGLASLRINTDLMGLARERSQDMVTRGYFSHYDPDTGEAIAHRWSAAENISQFSLRFDVVPPNLAQRIVGSWMESDGHRANILKSEAQRTGVGVAANETQIVVTQLFGK
jgi:uncharacterized protein YkwD